MPLYYTLNPGYQSRAFLLPSSLQYVLDINCRNGIATCARETERTTPTRASQSTGRTRKAVRTVYHFLVENSCLARTKFPRSDSLIPGNITDPSGPDSDNGVGNVRNPDSYYLFIFRLQKRRFRPRRPSRPVGVGAGVRDRVT